MHASFIEALKELGRVVVLAVIPILITSLENMEIDWRLVGTVAAIAALRAIDKWLHLTGKEKSNDLLTAGLTRF